jgi:hypothetical protein
VIAYYKALGILIVIACIVLAFVFYSKADIRSVQAENDFVNAMLHSESMHAYADQGRLLISLFIAVAGFGIGSFCFGIGAILGRLER